MTAAVAPPPSVSPGPAIGARHALLLLVLINLFNYIDRQVLAAVEPKIRLEFFAVRDADGNPVLTESKDADGNVRKDRDGKAIMEVVETEGAKSLMGLLSFAFLFTYMLAAPVFGSLATRMSRWLLIGVGVVVWSLASGASGLAPALGLYLGGGEYLVFGYVMPMIYIVMLLTRCFVGIGEAVYGPVAPDVISDLFPAEHRGRVLAWFYAAIPFGGALGYALGELVTSATGDWRNAFYVVVPPGILLGVWCLMMKEPARGLHGGGDNPHAAPKVAWSVYGSLLRIPSYAYNTVGMTFMCFAMGGLAFWAPGFLEHRRAGEMLGLGPNTFFGAMTAVLGLLATIAGGLTGDWLRPRWSGAYFLVSGAAMILAFPALLLMVSLPFPLAWAPMGAFVFLLFFNTGPTNTILANVVPPGVRSHGFALNILVIHLLGDAISPFAMGAIIGKENNYDLAFQVVSAMVLAGGVLWMLGARHLKEDTERAQARAAV